MLQGALVLDKSGRMRLGDDILQTYGSIFNHCDIIGLQSYNRPAKLSNWPKKQNKGYYAFQGHRGWYQSKVHMQLSISD